MAVTETPQARIYIEKYSSLIGCSTHKFPFPLIYIKLLIHSLGSKSDGEHYERMTSEFVGCINLAPSAVPQNGCALAPRLETSRSCQGKNKGKCNLDSMSV